MTFFLQMYQGVHPAHMDSCFNLLNPCFKIFGGLALMFPGGFKIVFMWMVIRGFGVSSAPKSPKGDFL